MQESSITVFQVRDKTEGMLKKFRLWIQRLNSEIFEKLPSMADFVQVFRGSVPKEILNVIKSHVEQLHLQLREYFPVTDDSDM